MRIVNHTPWPDSKIREIIEFAATPLNIKTMKITCEPYLKNDDGFSVQGRKEIAIEIRPDGKERHSYPYVDDFSTAVGYHITKRIGDWVYKVKHLRKTGYLPHLILSKEEDILHVIAHELRHQWQETRRSKSLWYYNTNTKRRTKKGDETDADAYAITTVRRWRKIHR